MGVRSKIRGLWLQWPWADVAVPASALLLWAVLGCWVPPELSRVPMHTATSAAAGIGLAGAAFVCTIFYQSSNDLLDGIRTKFGPLIRRNWVWILSTLLAAVALPIASIVVDATSAQWATALTMSAGLTFLTSFTRVIYWFYRTLGVLSSPSSQPVPVQLKNVHR